MAISKALIVDAAHSIASVQGVHADARAVIEDAYLLAFAFTAESEYLSSIANTRRALGQLVSGSVSPAQLKYDYRGWQCYHYQHKVAQGARADMRIVFKRVEGGVCLRAFGHRSLPVDFYDRISIR